MSLSDDLLSAVDAAASIGAEVTIERTKQVQRFGQQDHPDGTSADNQMLAELARAAYENAKKAGCLTWLDVLREETEEVAAETNPARLREELIQVAAVCVAWVESIDRRSKQ